MARASRERPERLPEKLLQIRSGLRLSQNGMLRALGLELDRSKELFPINFGDTAYRKCYEKTFLTICVSGPGRIFSGGRLIRSSRSGHFA